MSSKYPVSEKFHEKYKDLYDHVVVVILKNGSNIVGAFTDEFYENESILISPAGNNVCIIKIEDIDKMELSSKD